MSAQSCRICQKPVEVFAVIRWNDLTGYCTTECFLEEARRTRAQHREQKIHDQLKKYGRVIIDVEEA